MSMHWRDKDACLDPDSVWRWTVIVHEDGTDKMRCVHPAARISSSSEAIVFKRAWSTFIAGAAQVVTT